MREEDAMGLLRTLNKILKGPAHLPVGEHRRLIFAGCGQTVFPEMRILDDVRVC